MKFRGREWRAKGRVRLHRARGSAELNGIASGSATQALCLRNGKVRSQVSGINRSRFPGRRTVRKVRREGRRGRRASDRAKTRVYRFRVRPRWKRRASRLSCLSLGFGSKSLALFTNRFFHLSRPPGFRRAFDAAEKNGRFGRIQSQRSKESSSRGKRKRRVILCWRTVRVKIRGKAIPVSFLKIDGRGTLVGAKDRKEWDR